MRWIAATAAAAVIVSVVGRASAQNPRDVLLGGRTASMGGAGTAEGNDSAMPYLNPAGMAGLPNDVLAVSASVYGYSRSSYDGYFHPRGFGAALGQTSVTREDLSAKSVMELPSSVMYVKHLPAISEGISHVAGVSLVIPVADRVDVQGSYSATASGIMGSLSESRAISQSTTSYYVGPSYALSWKDKVRVGASAYAVYGRSVVTEQTTASILVMGGAAPLNTRGLHSAEYNSLAISPIVGAQFQPVTRLWLGFAVAPPSIPISGNASSSTESSGVTAESTTSQPIAYENTLSFRGNRRLGHPMRINAGVAWIDPGAWGIAADVHWYAPRSGAVTNEGVADITRVRSGETTRSFQKDVNTSMDYRSTLDLSVGGEVWVSKLIALRGGFLTDFADTAELKETTELADFFRGRLNRWGVTAGVGVKTGSFDSTLGGFFIRGTGKIIVPDYTSDAGLSSTSLVGVPIDVTTTTVGVILSTMVTTAQAQQTISHALPKGGL